MEHDNNQFNILIVDDVAHNIQIVANILENAGYQTAYAMSGETALEQAQDFAYDLILLDIMMPGTDGYDTCRLLKKNPLTKDIPVIFITAKKDTDNVVMGFEIGAQDYITKPFQPAELLARVKTHLELKSARESLEEANVAKDKFFSVIAHDLRGQFHILLGLSDVLMLNDKSFDETRKNEYIKKINQSAYDLYKFLENLLEWSRMQQGMIKWQPQKINLRLIAATAMLMQAMQAKEKKISLTSHINDDLYAYGDSDTVEMVIRNLVSNALKFTHPGGAIQITGKANEDFQEITVADTGIGIAVDNIEKLFRTDTHYSTKGTDKEKGSGLGLILCKEFIQKNGGRIWAESVEGQGSRFIFTVPRGKKLLSS
ncbi:hybrid sensor histidine kinase/response regulator [Desulfococcaceae bacterium HSG9]|nr:hybrid sensor histidine kinase/response regulator [Desulfococcaceae bacterium HSG9]